MALMVVHCQFQLCSWVLVPCGNDLCCLSFRGACCVHLQGWSEYVYHWWGYADRWPLSFTGGGEELQTCPANGKGEGLIVKNSGFCFKQWPWKMDWYLYYALIHAVCAGSE